LSADWRAKLLDGSLHRPFRLIGTFVARKNNEIHGKEYLMIAFKRILCPTDLSEESLKALPYAIEFARAFDGEIVFIHVLPALPAPEADFGFGAAEMLELESTLRRDGEQSLERFLQGRIPEDTKTRRVLGQGHAAEEILRAADEYKVGLITIATHGLTGWRHLAFGSIAEKVVRTAKIPVLTVSAKVISREQEMMCPTLLSIPR
jgi:nucleotide-binding universal stress UspA family protein